MTTALGEGLDLLELFSLPAAALDWQESAGCRGHEASAFFPPLVGRSRYAPVSATAAAICAGCPVRVECLLFGLDMEDEAQAGVWGGFNLGAKDGRAAAREWLDGQARRIDAVA